MKLFIYNIIGDKMNSTIVLYIILIIIILYNVFTYLYEILWSDDSKRMQSKRLEYIKKDSNFEYDLFKRSAIIKCFNNDVIDTNVKVENTTIDILDIKDEIVCDTFIIGENIKVISNLNLKANNVISYSKYTVKDDAIFDPLGNLLIIYKDKAKEELKELACKYSISKKALKYFSNGVYLQFAQYKKKYELRFSKPYYDTKEDLYAIVPSVIENKYVEAICINYSNVLEINIPKSVDRVIIEKKSWFHDLSIDNENYNFVIINNTLFDISKNTYVNDGFNTFNYIGVDNKKALIREYKHLAKNYFKLNKLTLEYRTENEVASDLQ